MAQLLETVYLDSAPVVDADKGEIRNVKLLGMESRNGRRYRQKAMENAVPLYRNRKIYIDHPSRDAAGAERSMDRWAGTIKEARFSKDGIYGDIKLRKESGYFKGIIEAAQEFPNDVGFSHVADGDSRMDGSTEIVESIKEVFSVDLVTDPATTAGFFESDRSKKKPTIKTAIESLPASTVRTRLIEMMDLGSLDGSAPMDSETASDPMSQMAALMDRLVTMLGETLKALAMKEDSPPPPAAPEAQPAPEEEMPTEETKPADKPEANPADQEAAFAFESVKRENAELKAKTLLLESGREPTAIRIKALADADEADRVALLESWPQLEAGERPAFSPALLESDAALDFPRDPKKFAALLR